MGTNAFVDHGRLEAFEFTDNSGQKNKVFFRAELSISLEAAIQQELVNISMTPKQLRQASDNGEGDQEFTVRFSQTRQIMVLLKYCLKRWEGPKFRSDYDDPTSKPIPCTPKNIERLNYKDEYYWIDPLAEKIGIMNRPRVVSNPTAEDEANGITREMIVNDPN